MKKFLFSIAVLAAWIAIMFFTTSLIEAVTGIKDPYIVYSIFIAIVVGVLLWLSIRQDRIAEKREAEQRSKGSDQ